MGPARNGALAPERQVQGVWGAGSHPGYRKIKEGRFAVSSKILRRPGFCVFGLLGEKTAGLKPL